MRFFSISIQIKYFIIQKKIYMEENLQPETDRERQNGKTRKQIERVIKRILMFALLLHGSLSGDTPVATLSMNT